VEVEAKAAIEVALKGVEAAQIKLKKAEEAISASSGQLASALVEKQKVANKVADIEVQVEGLRNKVRRYGGTGGGTNEAEPPEPTDVDDQDEVIAKSALKDVSDRELGEVRKLTRPPMIVQRALELVNVLLRAAEGKDASLKPVTEDIDWSELQTMLANPGFIKRVLALTPLALSRNVQLLEQINERWPSIKDAAGTSAAAAGKAGLLALAAKAGVGGRRGSIATLKRGSVAAARGGKEDEASAPAPAAVAPPSSEAPPADSDEDEDETPTPLPVPTPAATAAVNDGASDAGASSFRKAANGGRRGLNASASRFAATANAAKAEAAPNGPALTVEAVEYASRPCGAIFRWCANVLVAAMSMGSNREAAQAELDAALRKLDGVRGELAASEQFSEKLSAEDQFMANQRQAAVDGLELCKDQRLNATLAHKQALEALEEARNKAANGAKLAKLEGESYVRRQEDMEKRKKDEAEKERLAAEAAALEIERDLATREPVYQTPASSKLVWLHEHKLPDVKPLEFLVNASTLPPDAHVSLARIAKELQVSPELKLHIAGHSQTDEDAKLASQRAQAVGAALIALGAMPSKLRAKGYGATVTLSAAMRARLRLKSDRRVGLHAISEVGSRYGCEFAAKATNVSDHALELLREIATLCRENRTLRLSVEGHTDDRGEPAENAKLSVSRAQSVCRALESLGIDVNRMVPHGFGATLPLSDNTSEDGRQRNRRVQFLVIPDVTRAANK